MFSSAQDRCLAPRAGARSRETAHSGPCRRCRERRARTQLWEKQRGDDRLLPSASSPRRRALHAAAVLVVVVVVAVASPRPWAAAMRAAAPSRRPPSRGNSARPRRLRGQGRGQGRGRRGRRQRRQERVTANNNLTKLIVTISITYSFCCVALPRSSSCRTPHPRPPSPRRPFTAEINCFVSNRFIVEFPRACFGPIPCRRRSPADPPRS